MIDTVLLNYSVCGAGLPVVLLHGFPLSSEIWSKQRSDLSQNFMVITPDLRGHGLSKATGGIYEMDILARDVLALLDYLQIPKAVIIGHSMGGYVALAAWHQSPDRFLGLGLIASQDGADTEDIALSRHKTAEKVWLEGSEAIVNVMLPKLFSPGESPNVQVVESVKKMMALTPVSGIIGSLSGMASRADFSDELANIKIPVLILSGELDQIIPAAKAMAMAVKIRNSTLKIIPKSGHLPMLDNPEATSECMNEFLLTIEFRDQMHSGLLAVNDGTASYS